MRAEFRPFVGIERLLQQRAEDRGLDLAPVVSAATQQLADLLAAEQGAGVAEQFAVEFANFVGRIGEIRPRSSPSRAR